MAKDTRELLLETAEQLFAQRGIASTSIRELSRAARVNVAAVNYHFGSKEGLIKALLQRRLRPINQKRLTKLEELLTRHKTQKIPPSVKEVVHCFVAPAFEAFGRDNSTAFLSFLGRAMLEPDPQVREFFLQEMQPVIKLLWEALRAALPHLEEGRLFWRIQFLLGAMVRILNYPHYKDSWTFFPKTHQEISPLEEFITFVSAGLEANDA